jgi:hypothetical protein
VQSEEKEETEGEEEEAAAFSKLPRMIEAAQNTARC